MITVESKVKTEDGYQIDFNGLSSDTKPTDTYGEYKIGNGSTFMELDTKTVLFYDSENDMWR